MATYHWDFGFDWNADVNNGTYYLQNGFASYSAQPSQAGTASPSTPYDLTVSSGGVSGDLVCFFLYDVTSAGVTSSPYTVSSVTFTFSGADNSTATSSPFSVTSITANSSSTPTLSPWGVNQSAIFGRSADGEGTEQSFPTWGLGTNTNNKTGYQVVNSGHYLFTVSAIVTSGTAPNLTTKTFVVDPEMAAGAFG